MYSKWGKPFPRCCTALLKYTNILYLKSINVCWFSGKSSYSKSGQYCKNRGEIFLNELVNKCESQLTADRPKGSDSSLKITHRGAVHSTRSTKYLCWAHFKSQFKCHNTMFISGETVIILRIVFSTETGHWIKYYMRIVSIHDSM